MPKVFSNYNKARLHVLKIIIWKWVDFSLASLRQCNVTATKGKIYYGLSRDLNPGPLAPKARIIPLDQRAERKAWHLMSPQWNPPWMGTWHGISQLLARAKTFHKITQACCVYWNRSKDIAQFKSMSWLCPEGQVQGLGFDTFTLGMKWNYWFPSPK